MKHHEQIRAAQNDPLRLEQLYQAARLERGAAEFTADLRTCYAECPANILYAAWHYRLQESEPVDQGESHRPNWTLAIPLSSLTGLILGLLSNPRLTIGPATDHVLALGLLAMPVVGLAVITYLALTARQRYGRTQDGDAVLAQTPRRALLAALAILVATAYALLLATTRSTYRDVMMLHLPLLAVGAVGYTILGERFFPPSLFAVLRKTIEVVVTSGVYAIALVAFAAISYGMFEALDLTFPQPFTQAWYVGLAGLVPLVAVAFSYDPLLVPLEQDFGRGLSKMVELLPRLLLPLILLLLVVYLLVIPFNFMAPFRQRDVLIVYNAMLFGIMAVLVAATPLREEDLTPRWQTLLRRAMIAVAGLVVLVSLYALAATVYRTVQGGWTLNRLTIIGWNVINIGLLILLIIRQRRDGASRWIASLHEVFCVGTIAYLAWAAFLWLVTPWIF
jgi:hypothetical protein